MMPIRKPFIGKQLLLATLVLTGLTVVSPQAANAQWAVFDGANYAELGSIWGQNVSMGVKMAQELQQGLMLYNNAVQIYGVASQEASYLRNKQILLAVGFLAQHAMIPGQPGWDRALTATAGIAYAGTVWQQMTARGAMNSMQAINSRIQLADSFGASMLNSIGSCNAAAQQTNGSLSSLEQMAIDLSPSANTRANQANLNNMGQTQALRVQQCQQNIQQQQAQLQMLHALAQREQDQAIYNMRTADAATRSQLTTSNTANDIASLVDR
jgi:hypothetical protein